MNKGFQNKAGSFKQIAFRYGIAVASFIVTLAIALLFQYFSIKLDLAILVLFALVIPSWFGGRGPGLFVTFLILTATILMNRKPAEMPILNYIFSIFSGALVSVIVVLLVSSRRKSEDNLRAQRE